MSKEIRKNVAYQIYCLLVNQGLTIKDSLKIISLVKKNIHAYQKAIGEDDLLQAFNMDGSKNYE